MFRFLHPDFIVDCVTEFDRPRLVSLGVRGLLLDVDGALKPHYGTEILPAVAAWIAELREAEFKLAFFSNGLATRIAPLAASVGVRVFAGACKPLPFLCRRAIKEMGLTPAQTLIVGDQLFTDVLCGRLVGTITAYVRPLSPEEPFYTRFKRPLERLVLGHALQRSGHLPAAGLSTALPFTGQERGTGRIFQGTALDNQPTVRCTSGQLAGKISHSPARQRQLGRKRELNLDGQASSCRKPKYRNRLRECFFFASRPSRDAS